MTSIYRVTSAPFARSPTELLSGTGGVKVAGRWHCKGSRVAYFAASRALGVLERLVHLSTHPAEDGSRTVAAEVQIPAQLDSSEYILEVTADELFKLEPNWREPNNEMCLRIGALWYDEGTHLMLRVPSAIIPEESNTLVNCQHPLIAELIEHAMITVKEMSLDKRIVDILDFEAIRKRSR